MCLPSGSGSLNKSECGYSWVVLFPISTDLIQEPYKQVTLLMKSIYTYSYKE